MGEDNAPVQQAASPFEWPVGEVIEGELRGGIPPPAASAGAAKPAVKSSEW